MILIERTALIICTVLVLKVAESLNYQTQVCLRSRTDVIVQLFEWKWKDIAEECENFLGPNHFCAVQVSPPNENRIISNRTHNRPWMERYEPVSYKIQTRSGNESEFRDMISRCNRVKVSVYADIVINHMTDVNHHGYGTGGSVYHGEQRTYPAVSYSGWDFHDSLHCHTKDLNVDSNTNPEEVRNCQLNGKADLNHQKSFVQDSIVDYLNVLIDLGVSGFRIASAKYMWPQQIKSIFDRLKNVNGGSTRPFLYHEFDEKPGDVIQMSEYFPIGRVEYDNYGKELTKLIRNRDLKSFNTNWGISRGFPSPGNIVTFIDDQIKQRDSQHPVFTHFDRRMYEVLNALLLAYHYGIPRVFSGYSYSHTWDGPPHNVYMSTADVSINSNGDCQGTWTCEHRWNAIYKMVKFREVTHGATIRNWWTNHANQIAFSLGSKGFIAINAESGSNLDVYLQTGLPSATYCDVISGSHNDCSGLRIFVRTDGLARITIPHNAHSAVVALHVGSMYAG